MKESVRDLYVHTENCLFANEQSFVEKYDIGGTNFWPIEHFDMVQNQFTNISLHRLML